MAKEHIMSWQIGAVKVSRIVEIYNFTDNINMTIADATPDEVLALDWLQPNYATPEGEQRLNFQGFVIEAPGPNGVRTIVMDTCIGAGREREFEVFNDLPEGFLEDLASLGIAREEVDTVFCSHLHFDHVGWNTYKDPATGDYRPTFPNAQYLFGKTEFEAWKHLRNDGVHNPNHMIESVDPIMAAGMAQLVDADHVIAEGDGWRLVCEPSHGHTPGHIHLRILSGGEEAVIIADMMHHPMQCAMPHRTATFDMDKEAGRATRIDFVNRHKDTGVMVIGGHFFDPTAGHILTGPDGETWFRGLGMGDH